MAGCYIIANMNIEFRKNTDLGWTIFYNNRYLHPIDKDEVYGKLNRVLKSYDTMLKERNALDVLLVQEKENTKLLLQKIQESKA